MARNARKPTAAATHIIHVVDYNTGETAEIRCTSEAKAMDEFEMEVAEGRGEVYLYVAGFENGIIDTIGRAIRTFPCE